MRATVLLLTSAALLIGAGPATGPARLQGTVGVRVTDHREGIADFAVLEVTVREVALHARGSSRGTGWTAVIGPAPPVDLVPLKDGRAAALGDRAVPAGRYDAVRIRVGEVRGRLRTGSAAELTVQPATVAVDLEVRPARRADILIDFYVEDLSDHRPGQYAVKIRDVTAS